jgi:hypothetical protein
VSSNDLKREKASNKKHPLQEFTRERQIIISWQVPEAMVVTVTKKNFLLGMPLLLAFFRSMMHPGQPSTYNAAGGVRGTSSRASLLRLP